MIGGEFEFDPTFGYVFVVEDNATTGGPDMLGFSSPLASPPNVCPADPGPLVERQAASGDLVVHDAQPFPTSKDECKDSGWRNYPGFENQGDCVSFVATGRKNSPAG